MNGKQGEAGLSATIATRSIKFGTAALEQREADAIDRGEIRAALGDRGHARFMRAGHEDRREEGRSARDRRDRCAEQVHAGVAVVSVQRGDGAAKLTERSARIVQRGE